MKSSGTIKYRQLKSGGYELLEEAWVHTDIIGCAAQIPGFVDLSQDGVLRASKGYRWDGASGPVIDRRANMRAGLFHDTLYQLHRAGKLDPSLRYKSDEVYRQCYLEDGGWGWIAQLDVFGLNHFAGYAARPQPEVEVKVLTAP